MYYSILQYAIARKNVNDVMYEAGYADNKAFRSVFKKYTGLSPVEYKTKFSFVA